VEPNLIVFIDHIWLHLSKRWKKIEILFLTNIKGTTSPNKATKFQNKMSFNSRSNNLNTRKPFCAHCHNTGEPENVYTSHYPRSLPDRTGKTTVTCPKLQATECAYCYEFGHTRKFCPVLKANQRSREMEERRNKGQEQKEKQEVEQKQQKQRKSAGGYAALRDEDSDIEEEPVPQVKEEWPALSVATARTQTIAPPTIPPQNVTTGYAAMAAKPARVYEPEPETPVSSYQVLKSGDRMTKTEVQAERYVPISQRSWVEDEEEDEDW
jgi:hypothetical protein